MLDWRYRCYWDRKRPSKVGIGSRTNLVPERLNMEDWVAGYLSNFNSLINGRDVPDFLKDEDWDGLIAWIDNYCAANPLDKLEKAARELELDLLGHHMAPP